jgi:stage III sporulation protein SpoIIIAA
MTRDEAQQIAAGVRDHLSMGVRQRLKAIDVCPKLHQGMLTIRVYAHNQTAEDPPPFVFLAEEL